jgi:hypothetical protein
MTLPRRIRQVGPAIAAALTLLCSDPGAPSAAGRPMALAELSGGADLIVRGRVARVEGRWNGDRSAIHSDVAFAVDDTLKGALPTPAPAARRGRLQRLGGEVDGVRMVSSSAPAGRGRGDGPASCGPRSARARAAVGRAGSAAAAALVGQERGPTPSARRVETEDGREVGSTIPGRRRPFGEVGRDGMLR